MNLKNYPDTPFELFKKWFNEAKNCSLIKDATAVNIATSSKTGRPSNRMVLLKKHDSTGFTFYTNLESRKGNELKTNPYCALCFYWEALNKQIRIEGKTEQISDQEADEYFNSRPILSRIGTHISKQSRPMTGKAELLQNALKEMLENKTSIIKRPVYWSGIKVIPEKIEFWQAGKGRLHSRVLYSFNQKQQWQKTFLYP